MDGFSGEQVGRYHLSSHLGTGATGSVYKAIDTTLEDSPTFAVKCVEKNSHIWRQQVAEIVNHRALNRSPHVIPLCDFFEGDRHVFLVLPFCEMDMYAAIWGEKMYWKDDGLIKKAFSEILDGAFACHEKGVYHRDLKPENIMCNKGGTGVEIGDFGLSTDQRLCRGEYRCGTAHYMSPECLEEAGIPYYADRADVWSLGVILFNMVTCRYPWEIARPSDKKYMEFMLKKNYLLDRYPISSSLSRLLRGIFNPIPMARMSIPEIREAILDMDTFYDSPEASHVASPVSKEAILPDSQKTCVASVGHHKNEKKGIVAQACVPIGVLDQAPLCGLD